MKILFVKCKNISDPQKLSLSFTKFPVASPPGPPFQTVCQLLILDYYPRYHRADLIFFIFSYIKYGKGRTTLSAKLSTAPLMASFTSITYPNTQPFSSSQRHSTPTRCFGLNKELVIRTPNYIYL
jgi:hypothetical protein